MPKDGEILVGFEAHLKRGKLSIPDRSGHFNSGSQSLSSQETKNFISVMKNISKSSGYKEVNIKTGGKTVHQE
ncbi:MAG: hypothetical protein NE328_09010 [Lentisphaeraceae bacterium]|nr:hypothetical protein [Lentisphaeraceae bacterium]